MKKLLIKLFLLGLLAVFIGCDRGGEGFGDFSLELRTTEAEYVEFYVTAPSEIEIAYQVSTEAQKILSPAILFRNGTVKKVSPGSTLKISKELIANNHYFFYAVAKIDAENYSDIFNFEFTTKSANYTDLLTIVDTYTHGYKFHLKVPEETKARKNAIRYSGSSIAWFNLLESKYGEQGAELLAVAMNGDPYGEYGKVVMNDTTIVQDDYNILAYDENGDPFRDDVTDQEITNHDPIAPGEPYVLLAGECELGNSDDFEKVMGFVSTFSGETYSIPLYNNETEKWVGAFQRKEFYTTMPTECAATVDIEVENITAIDATINFTMGEGVNKYFFLLLDDLGYNEILRTYLDGHEEWFQWYLTSYIPFAELGLVPFNTNVSVQAGDNYLDGLSAGKNYHILCTVLGDEDGATQRFIHKTFTAKKKTKEAPEIVVTPIESDSSYFAAFNVKAPSKDIIKAYWAANYSREFQLMLNSGYTYETLLKSNYIMSDEDLGKLNSDEGLTMYFPTLDGEVTRLAVYASNDEGTYNRIDPAVHGDGWADFEAGWPEPDPKINSTLYEDLAGVWTASADIDINVQIGEDNIEKQTIPWESKVTISSDINGIPDKLDDSVYKLYEPKTKSEVDGMFSELKKLAGTFAEHRLDNQNRLLCTGFIDFDYYLSDEKDPMSRMEYKSPYDLFIDEDYASVDVLQLFYDFGPKWYLEVLENGDVIVPFNTSYLPPMAAWEGYPFYVAGVGTGKDPVAFYDSNDEYPGFPVEISADKDTIRIKPIYIKEDIKNGPKKGNYYMNSVGVQSAGSMELLGHVVSEIVLTRGYEETAPAAAPKMPRKRLNAVNLDGTPVKEIRKAPSYRSLSDFSNFQPVQYKVENMNVITSDKVEAMNDRLLKRITLK